MLDIPYEVAGYYTLRVIRPDGTERESCTFPNIITNRGLNGFGDPDSNWGYASYCAVGTGTTTPAAAQDALVAFGASTSTTHSANGHRGVASASPYYGYRLWGFEFPAGTAVGTWTEIGIGMQSDGTQLFTRALVTDSGGNATSITVLPGEILQVTYELRQYAPTSDVTSMQTIGGVSYSLRVRASDVTNVSTWGNPDVAATYGGGSGALVEAWDGTIAANTASSPNGQYIGAVALGSGTYTPNQYYLDRPFVFGLADGVGSISCFRVLAARGGFQIGITPAMTKTAAQTLTGSVRFTWARRTI